MSTVSNDDTGDETMTKLKCGIYRENEVTDAQLDAAEAEGRPVMVDAVRHSYAVGEVGWTIEDVGMWYNQQVWR